MAIETYDELKAAIADFLLRDDLTAVIPNFIALAEADIDRKVDHWRMEVRAEAELDAQYSAVPDDWLKTTRFMLSGTSGVDVLQPISPQVMMEKRMESGDASGKPCFYSLSAGQFEFFPTPDKAYDSDLVYIRKTERLSDTVATNWVLDHAPDALLFGALSISAPYLNNDERLQVWSTMYANALDGLNKAASRAQKTGTNRRAQFIGV
jgi:hypothetical protein